MPRKIIKQVCLNYYNELKQLKYYPSCASIDDEYESSIESMFLLQESDYNYFDVKIVQYVDKYAYDTFINAFNKHCDRVEDITLHISNIVNLDGTCTPLVEMQDTIEYVIDKIDYNKISNLEFNNKKIANEFTDDKMLVDFVKKYNDANWLTVIQTVYNDISLCKSVDEILLDVTKN